MGYAFISYSSINQASADAMRELLNKHNIDTWMAPYDIPAGSSYMGEINRALLGCDCLVLMLSEAAQNSQWVLKELERAVSYKKTIIPIKIEDIVLNDDFDFVLGSCHVVAVRKIDENSDEVKNVLNSVVACTRKGEEIQTSTECQNTTKTVETKQNKSLMRKLFIRKTREPFKEKMADLPDDSTIFKVNDDETINEPIFSEQNIAFESYEDFLNYIFRNYGTDIVFNKKFFVQLMQKFAASFENENRLLNLALELGVYEKLNLVDSKSAEEQNTAYRFALEQLRKSGIDSIFSEKVIMWYVKHLGWKPIISIGRKLYFGKYPFDENGEIRKIEWDIIDVKEGKALLLSTYCIDAHNYDDKSCNWQESSLKRWLGSEFRNMTFTNEENEAIVFADNESSINSINRINSGDSTRDKVFVLSMEQIKILKLSNEQLISKATPFAKMNGVFCDELDNAFWWIRTPGTTTETAALVNKTGKVNEAGSYVYLNNRGVRPALWIDIDTYNKII